MRRIAGMALLAATCAAVPGFAEDQGAKPTAMEEVLTMRVDGTIAVDATGKVLGHEITTELDPAVRKVIDQAAPNWLFFPPEVDGKPAAVKSAMRVTLIGKKVEAGYEIAIDNVLFSEPEGPDWPRAGSPTRTPKQASKETREEPLVIIKRRPMPKFPPFNVNGMVTILVHLDSDGSVLHAAGTQCSLYHARGSEKELKRACKAMEDATLRAVRHWKFAGPGLKDFFAGGTIPFRYVMEGSGNQIVVKASEPGNWRLESRTPYQLPTWAPEHRLVQRAGTSDLVGGELMPSSSPLRWRDSGDKKAL